MARALLLALLVAGLGGSGAHAAACRDPAVNAPLTAEAAWCQAGKATPELASEIRWTLEHTGLWQLRLEGLPGQQGTARIATYSADGYHANIWQGALPAAEGRLISPTLLLTPGDYVVLVTGGGDTLVYRLYFEPDTTLPPALASDGELVGGAAASLRGTGEELVVPWRLETVLDRHLWTFAAQPAPGSSASFTLEDLEGNTLLSSNAADHAGVLRLPDLALAAGSYRLSLIGLEAGKPVIVSALAEARPADFAAEPDGTPALAHAISPGRSWSGRLATAGAWDEQDFFRLVLPQDGGLRRLEATLSGPPDALLTLSLVEAEGRVLQQRQGRGDVRLADLNLGPGEHWLRVSGALDPAATYRLALEELGTPPDGAEREPNDIAAVAMPLPAQGSLVGSFVGDERDYIDIGVSGALQLWSVEATGEGLTQMQLYDGLGNAVATATAYPGEAVLRLSRLLLPPGRNLLRLEGGGGRWLLRSAALGPPTPDQEFEPNDDEARALVLPFERPQTGWLDRSGDRDLYGFHLAAEHHVRIELDGPADFPLQASLVWGGGNNEVLRGMTTGAPGQPQRLVWDSLLPPGDYILRLEAYAGLGLDPYRLSLSTQSYFKRPADLEPNDEAWQARDLPADGLLAGAVEDGGPDLFRIAADAGDTRTQLKARLLPPRGLGVRLLRDVGSRWPESLETHWLYAADEGVTLELPAGGGLLLQLEGAGAYALDLTREGSPVPPSSPPPITVALSFETSSVAAYEALAQRLGGTLTVKNESDQLQELAIATWVGDERWRLAGLPPVLLLPPFGQATLPIVLEIEPDAYDRHPVGVEVALSDNAAPAATARTVLTAQSGAPAVGAERGWPLPKPLLGGLDLAWSALGGSTQAGHAGLIDGIVDAAGVALGSQAPLLVDLAGDSPLPLAGVILVPPPGISPGERLADFAVEISLDGVAFTRVLSGRLSPVAREQGFPFETPLPAQLVRLVPLSRHDGTRDEAAYLAEFKAVALPGAMLQDELDIALPALGGHVIRATGLGEQMLTGETAIWPGTDAVSFAADRVGAELVLGFLNGRAARLGTLVWHERSDTPADRRARLLELAASSVGPLGPWFSLGRWHLDESAGTPPKLQLETPVWARALSLRMIEPASGAVTLPERIEVYEVAGTATILGEWGDMNSAGPFELDEPVLPELTELAAVGHTAISATPLGLGERALGRVQRGVSEDWYALTLPVQTRWLRASFAGGLPPEVQLTLVDGQGRETVLLPLPGEPGELAAAAGPGPWRLRVSQPPQSVVAAWDTSGSVAGFLTGIVRIVQQLSWDIDPAREALNLLPFRGEGSVLLLDGWSGEAAEVYGALHAYGWADNSSDAESALLVAAQALGERVGVRAVVLISDAAFGNVYRNEELWRSLEQGRVRVFALHLPVDADPRRARAQANLMRDWSQAAGGFYARFASQGDGEAAFRRLAAWLDRPVGYEFAPTAETAPLTPGRLAVVLEEPALAGGEGNLASPLALEIVLDASGSMLAQLEGRARIDIAKEMLRDLVLDVLPAGLPVGLRVFGDRAGQSCRSAVAAPLAPLDRAAFIAALEAIRVKEQAKTALAESIRLAGEDLRAAAGTRLLLLITDGEETCGGDPLAEIERLVQLGLEVRLNIVGFAVADAALRQTFADWAAAGGGAYFDAGDGAALKSALQEAAALPVLVLDERGEVAAEGYVNGVALELPPGRYRLVAGGEEHEVEIRSGEEITIVVGRS